MKVSADQYQTTLSRAQARGHRGLCLNRTAYALHTSMQGCYWRSILWSIDRSQIKVSAAEYHMTISWAQVRAHRGKVFFEFDR